VRWLYPDPTSEASEARDGDCMGSSALRLLILRKWSQVARMSVSKRIPPTVPPMIAAIGIRFTARNDPSDNGENVMVSLEALEEELGGVVGVNVVDVPVGILVDKRNAFSSASLMQLVLPPVTLNSHVWDHD